MALSSHKTVRAQVDIDARHTFPAHTTYRIGCASLTNTATFLVDVTYLDCEKTETRIWMNQFLKLKSESEEDASKLIYITSTFLSDQEQS